MKKLLRDVSAVVVYFLGGLVVKLVRAFEREKKIQNPQGSGQAT